MDQVIDYAVRHATDFHQFMLYFPSAGTPLYHELEANGQLKTEEEFPWPDWHGQLAFSWRHPHLRDGEETGFLLQAFQRDFDVNGPSIVRTMQTILKGWKRYKDHPDPRVRRRFSREALGLRKAGVAAVAATREYYRDKPALHAKLSALLDELFEEFGERSRHVAEQAMPYLLESLRAQEKKLADGWVFEPPTFYEINDACQARFAEEYPQATACLYVTPPAATPAATPDDRGS